MRKINVIVVSGVPCTGKTTLSKLIAKKFNFKCINVNKFIKENKLYNYFDRKRNCFVVDVKKLNKYLIKLIKKSKSNLIIDSHLAHYLPKNHVDLCIITKCNLKELKLRLNKRKYDKLKIKENLESEIFDVCLNEAKELGHNVLVVDTTKAVKDLNIKILLKSKL